MCYASYRLTKKRISELGVSSLEILILIAFGVAVAMPAFWVMYDKYASDDLTDDVLRGFARLQNKEIYYVGLDITGIRAPRDQCLVQKLQEVSMDMFQTIGQPSICTILLEKTFAQPVDPLGYESSDENGMPCTVPAPADLVNLFESTVDPLLSSGKVYCAGVFLQNNPEYSALASCDPGVGFSVKGGLGLQASNCSG